MNGQLVAVEAVSVPSEYLLAKLLKLLKMPKDLISRLTQETKGLAYIELKEFNGSHNDAQDRMRAEHRVLKLYNLGLEKIAIHSERLSSEPDLKIALNVLLKAPMQGVYEIGKECYADQCASIQHILDQSYVRIKGQYFMLINQHDYETLHVMANIDMATGTLQSLRDVGRSADSILRKLKIIPLLQINERALGGYLHWASPKIGVYRSHFGIIDRFLTSLAIACMFRKKAEMTTSRHFEKYVQAISGLGVDFLKSVAGGDFFTNLGHVEDDDLKRRLYSGGDNSAQQAFLFDFMLVSQDEVTKFSELVLYEPGKFANSLQQINEKVTEYFWQTSTTLKIALGHSETSIITEAMHAAVENASQQVLEFYDQLGEEDESAEEIISFWDQRVLLENSQQVTILRDDLLAKFAVKDIDCQVLCQMPIGQMIKLTKYFICWPEKKRQEFCSCISPNLYLEREQDCMALPKLLRNLSVDDGNDWPEEIGGPNTVSSVTIDGEIFVPFGRQNSFQEIMKKISWRHLNPHSISRLWFYGSSGVRDFMLEHVGDFKISMHALRHYYIDEHVDGRLLRAVLKRLINEDVLKPKIEIWEGLLFLTEHTPVTRSVIIEEMNRHVK